MVQKSFYQINYLKSYKHLKLGARFYPDTLYNAIENSQFLVIAFIWARTLHSGA